MSLTLHGKNSEVINATIGSLSIPDLFVEVDYNEIAKDLAARTAALSEYQYVGMTGGFGTIEIHRLPNAFQIRSVSIKGAKQPILYLVLKTSARDMFNELWSIIGGRLLDLDKIGGD